MVSNSHIFSGGQHNQVPVKKSHRGAAENNQKSKEEIATPVSILCFLSVLCGREKESRKHRRGAEIAENTIPNNDILWFFFSLCGLRVSAVGFFHRTSASAVSVRFLLLQ